MEEDLIDEVLAWVLKSEEENELDLYDEIITKLKMALMEDIGETKHSLCTSRACTPADVLEKGTTHFKLVKDEKDPMLVIFSAKQLLKNKLKLQLTPKQFAELLGGEYSDVKKSKELTDEKMRRSVVIIAVNNLPEDVREVLGLEGTMPFLDDL